MATEGQVFDLGYRRYDGPRLGRVATTLAVVRDGVRRVLGLRRRARRKVLPWSLIVVAFMPSIVFLAFALIAGELVEGEIFGHDTYFDLTQRISLLFVALAAGELLVPDRTYGTLQVYSSRPVSADEYLAARFGAMGAAVAVIMLVPQVFLFVGSGLLASDGFLNHVSSEWTVLPQVLAVTSVYLLAHGPPALAIASITPRASVAAAVFAGVMLLSSGITTGLVDEAGVSAAGLAAFEQHPRYVAEWIFGSHNHVWIPQRAGYDPWVSLAVIGGVAVVCVLFLRARYRSLL
ncbi:MAG: ABC transporter permease [Acidimicrobiia bacterium]